MGWPALVAGRSTVLADLEHIVNNVYCSLHCMLDTHYHFVKSWISMVTSMKTTDCYTWEHGIQYRCWFRFDIVQLGFEKYIW